MPNNEILSFNQVAKKLQSADRQTRKDAAVYVKANLDSFEEDIPAFIDLFKVNRNTGREVVFILTKYAKKSNKIVDLLIKELDKKDENTLWGVIFTLGQIGKEAERIYPKIMQIAKEDKRKLILSKCIWAFGKLGTLTDDVQSILLESVTHSNEYIRAKTLQAIGRLGGNQTKEILLNALFREKSNHLRRIAIGYLPKYVKNEKQIVKQILEYYSREENPKKKFDYALAITKIEKEKGIGLEKLTELITNHDFSASDENIVFNLQKKFEM